MSQPCLFGMEWECAFGQANLQADTINAERAFRTVRDALRELQPWLPDVESITGIFLPGCRFYLDAGGHPEIAGVEVTSPDEFVALKQANFALFTQALHQARHTIPGLIMLANNHDYLSDAENGDGTFWGCHESYATRLPPDALAAGMLPFLASRPLIAGSGRIDPHGRVLLSPRAQAIESAFGGSTTAERALVSTGRNESLMRRGPFRYRNHVICGDAVVSPWTEYLKVGTTALVLHWLQENPTADKVSCARPPLRLLHKANILWKPEGTLRIDPIALAVQRWYCAVVSEFVYSHKGLPSWCAKTVQLWDETLRLLANDPLALSDRHDPLIKLAMFDAALAEMGKEWTDIARDSKVYQQLALLDLAYHQIDDDGPLGGMTALVRKVRRCLPGLESAASLQEVVSHLPTRAAPRAQLLVELSGNTDVQCGWNSLQRNRGDWIDLGDPTCSEMPQWQTPGVTSRKSVTWIAEVPRLHSCGAYEQAARLLAEMAPHASTFSRDDRIHYLRQLALVESRRGDSHCITTLDELAGLESTDLMLINDYVCAYHYLGLAPPPQIETWISRGRDLLSAGRVDTHANTKAAFLGHVGFNLLRSAQPERAREVLTEAKSLGSGVHPHVMARALADLADAHRMLGQRQHAHELLREAETIQTSNQFEGDLADFTWTCRARLEIDSEAALNWLERAKAIQTRLQNGMGEARTLVLQARLMSEPAATAPLRARLLELQTQRPALATCAALRHILDHWKEWTAGQPKEGAGVNADPFWNV